MIPTNTGALQGSMLGPLLDRLSPPNSGNAELHKIINLLISRQEQQDQMQEGGSLEENRGDKNNKPSPYDFKAPPLSIESLL